MDVREAVAKAKDYLSVVFADENVSELRLEEVEYDTQDRAWLITLGLMRPSLTGLGSLAGIMSQAPLKRTYKVVKIPEAGDSPPSIRIRELSDG